MKSICAFFVSIGIFLVLGNNIALAISDTLPTPPNGSLEQLQKTVTMLVEEMQKKSVELTTLRDQFHDLKVNFEGLKAACDQNNIQKSSQILLDSVPPIGFVYFQLPMQAQPDQIWPAATWTEVSHLYAGLFFRTVGGTSEPFGSIQNETCPRVTNVGHKGGDGDHNEEISLVDNDWSSYVLSGYSYAAVMTNREKIRFYTDVQEVKPTNTAFRIWTRTG